MFLPKKTNISRSCCKETDKSSLFCHNFRKQEQDEIEVWLEKKTLYKVNSHLSKNVVFYQGKKKFCPSMEVNHLRRNFKYSTRTPKMVSLSALLIHFFVRFIISVNQKCVIRLCNLSRTGHEPTQQLLLLVQNNKSLNTNVIECLHTHMCVFIVQIFSLYCIELASLIHDKYNLFLEML